MSAAPDRRALETIRVAAHRLTGGPEDFTPLLERIGDARYVLLGEASHGTHEFYRIRAEITKRLIREKGVHAVAVEADWPDAYRVNRYVRGRPGAGEASEALSGAPLPAVDVAQCGRPRLRRLAGAQRHANRGQRQGRLLWA